MPRTARVLADGFREPGLMACVTWPLRDASSIVIDDIAFDVPDVGLVPGFVRDEAVLKRDEFFLMTGSGLDD